MLHSKYCLFLSRIVNFAGKKNQYSSSESSPVVLGSKVLASLQASLMCLLARVYLDLDR